MTVQVSNGSPREDKSTHNSITKVSLAQYSYNLSLFMSDQDADHNGEVNLIHRTQFPLPGVQLHHTWNIGTPTRSVIMREKYLYQNAPVVCITTFIHAHQTIS